MEPPQYDGGLLGLQKREYLAKTETQYSEEFIVDMIALSSVLREKPHSTGVEIVDAAGDLNFARALQVAQDRA